MTLHPPTSPPPLNTIATEWSSSALQAPEKTDTEALSDIVAEETAKFEEVMKERNRVSCQKELLADGLHNIVGDAYILFFFFAAS